jgi:hypothetical protein
MSTSRRIQDLLAVACSVIEASSLSAVMSAVYVENFRTRNDFSREACTTLTVGLNFITALLLINSCKAYSEELLSGSELLGLATNTARIQDILTVAYNVVEASGVPAVICAAVVENFRSKGNFSREAAVISTVGLSLLAALLFLNACKSFSEGLLSGSELFLLAVALVLAPFTARAVLQVDTAEKKKVAETIISVGSVVIAGSLSVANAAMKWRFFSPADQSTNELADQRPALNM